MTATVSSTTSKPVTSALPVAPPPPRYAQAPTVSFRSLLYGDVAVLAPLPEAPPAAPPALLPQLPLQAQPLPPSAAPDADSGELPVDPDVVARVARGRDDDTPDPFHRQRTALGSPESSVGVVLTQAASAPPTAEATEMVRAQASLEDLIPALVRRVQWGGDGRKGTVRMELGAGELAGGTLQVSADHGHVRVQLDVPPGVDAAAWQARITARLAAQNIAADQIEVT